jgi:hypothetical protein
LNRDDIVKKFDSFFGIAMFPDGTEYYTHVNIQSGGSGSSFSIDGLYDFLLYDINNGKKILLNISPKYESKKRTRTQVLDIIANSMAKFDGDVPDFTLSENNISEEEYELTSRIYLPLDVKDQLYLKNKFKKSNIPRDKNPFNYQITKEAL